MLTEKEKQLLFIDLCARLPYGVVLDNGVKLRTIDALTKVISGNGSDRKIEFVKPYLRPMSSMTGEEYREYAQNDTCIIYKEGSLDGQCVTSGDGVDYLNKHHLDYRGLIPMGLALPAPDGMYENYDTEEALLVDLDREIKEIINFDLLTDEQRIKALELAKTGYLAPTKYIHEVTGIGIKCSKIYYDMYIRPALI